MRVRYTPRAFAERERIFSYLEARNPQTARRVVGLIMQRIHELGSEPYKGRPTDRAAFSRCRLGLTATGFTIESMATA
jgi:plasmid stabilization system protein ParE